MFFVVVLSEFLFGGALVSVFGKSTASFPCKWRLVYSWFPSSYSIRTIREMYLVFYNTSKKLRYIVIYFETSIIFSKVLHGSTVDRYNWEKLIKIRRYRNIK